MLGECHAHIKLSYVEPEAIPGMFEDGSVEAFVRECLENYQKRDILFVRDGGDREGVSELTASIAPEYGIDYRTPIFAIYKNGYYGEGLGKGFDTLDEYRALVEEVTERGGDFIKIMGSGILDYNHFGVVTPGPENWEDELTEMVKIAHDAGYAVMIHANGPDKISAALRAGCDTIEHGFYMDDACRELFVQTGAIWVPTIVTLELFKEFADPEKNDLDVIMARQMEDIRLALKAGVNIAAGSDSSLLARNHGYGLTRELELLDEACQGDAELLAKLHATLEESFEMIWKKF